MYHFIVLHPNDKHNMLLVATLLVILLGMPSLPTYPLPFSFLFFSSFLYFHSIFFPPSHNSFAISAGSEAAVSPSDFTLPYSCTCVAAGELYLHNNPDVAAAYLDPVYHYQVPLPPLF